MQRKFTAIIIFLVTGLSAVSFAQKKTGHPIDVVFCLDLSNSSNGLIERFRNHIWDYWDFFTRCDSQPDYRIGVVTYARFSYGKSSGYTHVMRDLGTDFEGLSKILFKIPPKTEKGDQYVGAALNTCMTKMSWSKNPDAKKIIILIGNGEVNLGKTDLDETLDKLIKKNIAVNTIYCFAPGEREAITGWEKIALKTGGEISSISIHDFYIDSPKGIDMQRLRSLNRKLNNTYLFYGKNGRLRWRTLLDEDKHIFIKNPEGYRFRSKYKVSQDYVRKNSSWDLVDLNYKNQSAYLDVDKKLLNDTCKKMSAQQLKSYIIYKKYERRKISALMREMLDDKNIITQDSSKTERKIPVIETISIKAIQGILKSTGCECILN